VIWRVDSLLDLRKAYCVPHLESPEPDRLAFETSETLVAVGLGLSAGLVTVVEVGAAATVGAVVASAVGAAPTMPSMRPSHPASGNRRRIG
jgi:hypothetical protein